MLRSSRAIEEVEREIKQYLNQGTTDFYGMRLRLGPTWKVHSEKAFGRMMIDTSNCKTIKGKEWCSGFTVTDMDAGMADAGEGLAVGHCAIIWWMSDGDGYYVDPKRMPDVQLGGETAEYLEVSSCGPDFPGSYARIWYLDSKDIRITTFEFRNRPLTSLAGILRDAVWG